MALASVGFPAAYADEPAQDAFWRTWQRTDEPVRLALIRCLSEDASAQRLCEPRPCLNGSVEAWYDCGASCLQCSLY